MPYFVYFKTLITDCMYISFPLLIYLVYLACIKSVSKQEHKYLLTTVIIISFIPVMFFDSCNNYFPLLNIPLLLSYISKKNLLAISISIFLVLGYKEFYNINILILLIEYILYFILYLIENKKKKFPVYFTLYFLIIKLIFINIVFVILKNKHLIIGDGIHIIISAIVLVVFSILIVYFFSTSKNLLDMNTILKQLENEKKIKASIFKLNHELKNPLAVCNGYLEMIPTATSKKRNIYLNIIKEEIKRSIDLINDFSSLGKVKQLKKDYIDLAVLFQDIKEILNPLFESTAGKIIIPDVDELYINADYDRLKQVFINIIKNSYEARKKTPIEVKIKIKKVNNNYKIIASDNGKGMSNKELTRIYDMFYTTKENGSGVGVPFIREIIELHKGTVTYKSQKNKGTTVIVTLPN